MVSRWAYVVCSVLLFPGRVVRSGLLRFYRGLMAYSDGNKAAQEAVDERIRKILGDNAATSNVILAVENAVVRTLAPRSVPETVIIRQAVRATICIVAIDTYLSEPPVGPWPPYVPPL